MLSEYRAGCRSGLLDVVPNRDLAKMATNTSVLYQMSKVFSWLEHYKGPWTRPAGVCKAYVDQEGLPVDPMIQMDASEFFIGLCEQLEQQLTQSSVPQLLNCLEGSSQTSLVCAECGHTTKTQEGFYCLSLHVKGHQTLEEALASYSAPEAIADYLCNGCNRSVQARSCCLLL